MTRAVAAKLPAVKREIPKVSGRDLRPTESLRQRTSIVGSYHRKCNDPFTDARLGFGKTYFCRYRQPAEIICWRPVIVHRQQLRVSSTFTPIQLLRIEAQRVNAETDRAFCKT